MSVPQDDRADIVAAEIRDITA
ncbi:MAG: hypothetical protein RLZZ93_1276, partial [Actinomycetota bacterium]